MAGVLDAPLELGLRRLGGQRRDRHRGVHRQPALQVCGTIHYGGPWPYNVDSWADYILPSGTFHDDFHVFAVEWDRGEIRWYVDGVLFATRAGWYSTGGPFPAPFDVDFHLLLNLAVGGNLPGPPSASTVFPQDYAIDYVRVYQVPPSVTITSPTADDVIHPGDDLTIAVRATDETSILSVQFLQGSAVLAEDTTPPYAWTVPGVAAGCYTLRARATDDRGQSESILAGAGHGRQRLPAGALPDDACRSPGNDRSRGLRPRW